MGSSLNAFPVLLGALCVFAIGYRYYSAYIAAKALELDDRRTTPAHLFEDGHNYVPSPKGVLFGHHFAAIAGAGPLVGPRWPRSSALPRVSSGYWSALCWQAAFRISSFW